MQNLPLPLLTALCAVTSLHGATMELTLPTDYIVAVDKDLANPDSILGNTASFPANENPPKAIDNTLAKYLNFEKENSGFIVQPNTKGIINGIQFTSANDSPDRDPTTYTLEGSKNGGLTWQTISSGSTNIVAGVTPRNTTVSTIPLANTDYYADYRVVFPTLANSAGANSMQIAEVNLFGDDGSFRSVIPRYNIGSITPLGVYTPGGGGSEGVANLLDNNTATKLFDSGSSDGFLYNINVLAPSIVNGVRLATANDNATQGRNPTGFTLRGTQDGVNYTDIATLGSPDYRSNFLFYDFAFNNNTRYNSYQIFFPSAVGNGLQLSELQLFGLIPEPSRGLLVFVGLIGLASRRRRKIQG